MKEATIPQKSVEEVVQFLLVELFAGGTLAVRTEKQSKKSLSQGGCFTVSLDMLGDDPSSQGVSTTRFSHVDAEKRAPVNLAGLDGVQQSRAVRVDSGENMIKGFFVAPPLINTRFIGNELRDVFV